jgi:DoxX-like family
VIDRLSQKYTGRRGPFRYKHAEPLARATAVEGAGRVMSALPALFLLVDGGMKLVKPAPVVEATVGLGYQENVILGLACTVLYLVPHMSIVGAILLTGHLGGAVATHARLGNSLFSVFFPVILGVLVWGGLWLRDGRLHALVPWAKFSVMPHES